MLKTLLSIIDLCPTRALVICAGGLAAGSALALGLARWPKVGSPQRTVVASESRRLVCADGVWNFGKVDAITTPKLRHSFAIENHSAADVFIKEIRPTCGCMLVAGFEKRIRARGRLEFSVQLTLAPVPGPVHKAVIIETELPGDRLVLGLEGVQRLNASLRTFPPLVDFGIIRQGTTKTRELTIARFDGSPVMYFRVEFADAHLHLTGDPTAGQDGRTAIELRLDTTGLKSGEYHSSVKLHCAHEAYPEVSVPVRAIIGGGL